MAIQRQTHLSIAVFAICILTAVCAQAHPESISTIELQLQKSGAKVSLTLQIRDLNQWFPPGNHPDYKAFVASELKDQAAELFEFQADGQAVSVSDVSVHNDKPGCMRVDLLLKFPTSTQTLKIRTKSLDKLPSGHQQLLCAEDQRAATAPGDGPPVVSEQALTAEQDSAEISIPDSPTAATTQPLP